MYEKAPERWRRILQPLGVVFHAGLDELVHLALWNSRKILDDGVHDGIAHVGMGDVIVCGVQIDREGLTVTGPVGRGDYEAVSW